MSDGPGRSDGPHEIEILEIVGLDDSAPSPARRAEGLAPEGTATAPREAALRAAARREALEAEEAAARRLLRDLLPALDDLENCARRRPDFATLSEGVRMALRELWDVFRRHRLERIEGYGMTFDPRIHEAAVATPTDRAPANTVLETLRVGYMLGGELVRPALVRVAVEPTVSVVGEGGVER